MGRERSTDNPPGVPLGGRPALPSTAWRSCAPRRVSLSMPDSMRSGFRRSSGSTPWSPWRRSQRTLNRSPRSGHRWCRSMVVTHWRSSAMACTAQSALGGRFTLGIGPSHAMVVEGFYGESYDRPFTHTAEFVEALDPLLRGQPCDVEGDEVDREGFVDRRERTGADPACRARATHARPGRATVRRHVARSWDVAVGDR